MIPFSGTCDHQELDLNCEVCRLFMEDPTEDWGAFESTPARFPDPDTTA